MKTFYMDTESIQFIGPTVLIQYAEDDGEIKLHDVMGSYAIETTVLIERMMAGRLVGFNLAHDMSHLAKTYNLCKMLHEMDKPEEDINKWINLHFAKDRAKYCLLPKQAVDLMVIGQASEFQGMIKQKPITLKKVPKILAERLVEELTERINLNPMYFAGLKDGKKWKIKPLWKKGMFEKSLQEIGNDKHEPEDEDQDFVNLELPFRPKRSLKAIMECLFGYDVQHFEAETKKYKEKFWNPNSPDWFEVYGEWMHMWRKDKRQRQYAEDDIKYTRDLDRRFKLPEETYDSLLACMVGNTYWKGFSVDKKILDREGLKCQLKVEEAEIEFNSSKKVREYLIKDESPIVAATIQDTKAETLERLTKVTVGKVAEKAQNILDWRHADKRLTMCNRLYLADFRMYAQFKISGTATNRMSGGSMEGKGESINPQGIPSEASFREMFTFVDEPGWTISGGDAKSFEVSIAAAVFKDDNLTQELLNDKKFHAIFGSFIYKMSYEEVLETDKYEGMKNLYKRAKSGVFAWFYGGMAYTISNATGVPEEEIELGLTEMEKKYPGIRESRERIWNQFQIMKQEIEGGMVAWNEPDDPTIKSFLGYTRDFTASIECMRAIYDLAQDLPDDMKQLGRGVKLTRKEEKGLQSAFGATMSALFASAFAIQSQIMRIASNFVIQSPGGQMIKMLQSELVNTFQPRGCQEYQIVPFNVHDEIMVAHRCGLEDPIEIEVQDFVTRYKKEVPLFAIEWNKNKRNWSETH